MEHRRPDRFAWLGKDRPALFWLISLFVSIGLGLASLGLGLANYLDNQEAMRRARPDVTAESFLDFSTNPPQPLAYRSIDVRLRIINRSNVPVAITDVVLYDRNFELASTLAATADDGVSFVQDNPEHNRSPLGPPQKYHLVPPQTIGPNDAHDIRVRIDGPFGDPKNADALRQEVRGGERWTTALGAIATDGKEARATLWQCQNDTTFAGMERSFAPVPFPTPRFPQPTVQRAGQQLCAGWLFEPFRRPP